MTSNVTITIATLGTEDTDHQQISNIYQAVKTVMDSLFVQFRSGVTSDEYTLFASTLESELGNVFHLGGVGFSDGSEPFNDSGANSITIGWQVWHSRTDY